MHVQAEHGAPAPSEDHPRHRRQSIPEEHRKQQNTLGFQTRAPAKSWTCQQPVHLPTCSVFHDKHLSLTLFGMAIFLLRAQQGEDQPQPHCRLSVRSEPASILSFILASNR